LASSRDTQNGPDWTDVEMVLQDMQSVLDCRVIVECRLKTVKSRGTLHFVATAYPNFVIAGPERQQISVSAICATGGSGLGVALMYRLLIKLDFETSRAWAVKQV